MSEPTRSKEDVEKLVKAFSELCQIPKADTPEYLVQLMAKLSYTVKAESTSPHSHSSTLHGSSQPLTVINPVKLPMVSGDGFVRRSRGVGQLELLGQWDRMAPRPIYYLSWTVHLV